MAHTTASPHSAGLAAACLALTAVCASAQDDLRDKVTMTGGRVVEGRVQVPTAPDELLVLQGGKRVRVPRAKVSEIALVADKVREFFSRRQQHRDSKRALGYLADWARTNELPGLARLQAMELVLLDDNDERMHEALGHRRRGGKWLWQHDDRWRDRETLFEEMLEHPLRLVGERFELVCDAGLLTNVRALLDLEHMAVVFYDRLGRDLQLQEVLERIEIRTYRNATVFPKWGFRPRPYFVPQPHGDVGHTFYSGPSPTRPELLFFVGTQGLLYRSMIGQVDRQDNRDRACAWLEVGLGMHMQMLMQGDAGFAAPAPKRHLDLHALTALNRGYRLTHPVHLPMYASFYLTDDTATATNWAGAAMFTTWLLDESAKPNRRPEFLRYIRAALADRQGDSSSAFDKIMGQRIEEFDEPWRAWLDEVSRN